MSKHDFVNLLFANGDGLTLDQIQHIEDYLPTTIPDGIPIDNGSLATARDVLLDDIGDYSGDMLSFRDYFSEHLHIGLTDKQVFMTIGITR